MFRFGDSHSRVPAEFALLFTWSTHICSNRAAARFRPITLEVLPGLWQDVALSPGWRNWQTRQLEVLVGASSCRFESCPGHIFKLVNR